MQTEYTAERDSWIAGQGTRGEIPRCVTLVCAEEGQPQIVDTVFALTWAPNDDIVTTVAGIALTTTNIVGATPEAARDEHLVTILASTAAAVFGTWEAVDDDTIRFTSKERVPGSGRYYSVVYSVVETTAGDGTATETETQAAVDRADLRFGVGVVYDSTDERGKRAVLPSGSSDRFAGVAYHGHAFDNRHLPDEDGVPLNDAFAGLRQGCVAVRVDADVAAAIAPGAPAFLKYTADANGAVGQFRHNNTNAFAVPAVFTGRVQGSGATALAELEVNAP